MCASSITPCIMGRSINGIRPGTTKVLGHDPIHTTTDDAGTYDLDLKVDNSTIVINDVTGELNAISGAVDLDVAAPFVFPGSDPSGPKLSMNTSASLVVNGTTHKLEVNPGAFIDGNSLVKFPDIIPVYGGLIAVNTVPLTD